MRQSGQGSYPESLVSISESGIDLSKGYPVITPTSSKSPVPLSDIKRSKQAKALSSDTGSPRLSFTHSGMAMLRCRQVKSAWA
jgi:hypothetical protein